MVSLMKCQTRHESGITLGKPYESTQVMSIRHSWLCDVMFLVRLQEKLNLKLIALGSERVKHSSSVD